MRLLMHFTSPLRASLRMASLGMPWILSLSTFLCLFVLPFPNPFPRILGLKDVLLAPQAIDFEQVIVNLGEEYLPSKG
ncbi:unnamed protein product [Prunus armeniaca]